MPTSDGSECATVWLVDDSETDLLYARIVIEQTDPSSVVTSFESAEEALDALAHSTARLPDMIFLDINMPRMDGFAFIEAYERMPPDRRANSLLVMLSSSPLVDDRRRALGYASVSGYVTKPLSVDDARHWLAQAHPTS